MIPLKKHVEFNTEQFEDILIYFSKSLLNQTCEDEILWDLAKNCIAKLGFADCVVYKIDYTTNMLLQKAACGPKNLNDKTVYNPVKIPLGKGICGSVALTGKTEIVKDTSKDKRYIVDDACRLSEITVPILIDGIVYGVIDCEHLERNFFTEQHLKMLMGIASICSIKIKNIKDNNALLDEQKRLLQLKEEFIDLKLRAFNSQMNPHFVFNALNAIQYFISSGQKKSALEYLSIFSKLIRFYLKHIEYETVNLKDEINMLTWYLKLQKLRYTNRFGYIISIDDNQEKFDVKIPSFVVQTLFENLIEFAIYNQHKNEELTINFNISKTTVILQITYKHDPTDIALTYAPKYRQHLTKWQDQIRLLNGVKKYNIEKQVTFIKNKKCHGGHIILKLPNLATR